MQQWLLGYPYQNQNLPAAAADKQSHRVYNVPNSFGTDSIKRMLRRIQMLLKFRRIYKNRVGPEARRQIRSLPHHIPGLPMSRKAGPACVPPSQEDRADEPDKHLEKRRIRRLMSSGFTTTDGGPALDANVSSMHTKPLY